MMQVSTKFGPTDYDAGGDKRLAKIFKPVIQFAVNFKIVVGTIFCGLKF